MNDVLMTVENLVPVPIADKEAFFLNTHNQIQPVVDKIVKHYKSLIIDGTTEEGRKELKNLGAEINKVIALIDSHGKEINDMLKAKPKLIDAGRRLIKEQLTDLRTELMKPYTDYEAEQKRLKEEERARIEAERKAEQEELERLRAEKAQREREAKIAEEAAEKARLEAENKVKEAQHEAERIKQETELREQQRLAKEKQKADEDARRLADVDHKKQVKFSAYKCLLKNGIDKDIAIKVVNLVDAGEIQNIFIQY